MTPPSIAEAIDPDECRTLLAQGNFGRLAVIVDGHPDLFPVNYRVAGGSLIVATNPGSKLRGADMARVAFEVDQVSPDGHSGWSVVVKGTAYDITTAVDQRSTSLKALDVDSALGGANLLKIDLREVTGRRLRLVKAEDIPAE